VNPILHLREANLPPELAYKLTDIVSAYKQHSPVPSKQELEDSNQVDNIKETVIEEIQRLRRNITYHRQEYLKLENMKAYVILSELYYRERQ
jgi:hypothetical protein